MVTITNVCFASNVVANITLVWRISSLTSMVYDEKPKKSMNWILKGNNKKYYSIWSSLTWCSS